MEDGLLLIVTSEDVTSTFLYVCQFCQTKLHFAVPLIAPNLDVHHDF